MATVSAGGSSVVGTVSGVGAGRGVGHGVGTVGAVVSFGLPGSATVSSVGAGVASTVAGTTLMTATSATAVAHRTERAATDVLSR